MAMKRYLWILIAAPLLASCSASDAEEQAGGSATASVVSYDVTTDDITTRAAIANTEEFLTDGRQFRVWAFMKKDNSSDDWTPMTSDYNDTPLQAVDVTYVAWRNEWLTYDNEGTSTVVYYWPRPEYAVNFYAVYPAANYFNTTNKTLDYTVSADNTDVDLMYATRQGQRTGQERPQERKAVPLTFHHALTQVSFYGHLSSVLDALGWHIEVKSISICNVKSQGKLSLVTDENYNNHPKQFEFEENPTLSDYPMVMNPDVQPLTTYSTPTNQIEGKIPLTSLTNIAMLLPQELTAWNTNSSTEKLGSEKPSTNGCYLAVALRIKNSATNSYIFGTNADDGFITVYSPFDCGVQGGWQSGLHYHYVLTFNGGYDVHGARVIQPIGISASITDWTNLDPVNESIIQQENIQ